MNDLTAEKQKEYDEDTEEALREAWDAYQVTDSSGNERSILIATCAAVEELKRIRGLLYDIHRVR